MKRLILVLILMFALCMTGCWDRKDIETRGFVLGIAIDDYPPIPEGRTVSPEETQPEEEKKFEVMQIHEGKPMYAMTIQIPIVKKSLLRSPFGQGVESNGSKSYELTQIGNSFFAMNREMASRIELTPYYEHLQAIVISDTLARKGLHEILDFFLRDHEMRRRTMLCISDGEAKKILDVVPRIEDYSSLVLARLPLNSTVNSRIIHETDLGRAIASIHDRDDFLLPRVEATKDEIKSSGAAVFKENKMVGWATPIEVEYIAHIRGSYEGGLITAKDPNNEEAIITLEITSSRRKITPIIENNKPKFKIDLKIKGSIAEFTNREYHKLINKKDINKIVKVFENKIKNECEATIKNIQEKYGADVFHFNIILKTQMPEYWETINEKWHDIFKDVEADVNVQVRIQNVGNIR